jgi:Bacterial TSP3 repeat
MKTTNFRGTADGFGRLATSLGFLASLALTLSPSIVRAEIPEPDNVLYGAITLGVTPVTAANTNVVVEARKTATGPVVSSYRMGANAAYGNSYSLEIPLEAFLPLADTNAARVGALLYLNVRDESGVRDTRTISIAQRGQLVRLDFTELDTDGDGIPDRWELQYFGSATGGNANADPDGDGRNNLEEFVAGTNPLVADGRHPADSAPANNILSEVEAENYANAWLNGEVWPSLPSSIPIAYVTRAAFLAANGGNYIFTNAPATNAPNWWVNLLRPAGAAQARTNAISVTMPANGTLQSPFTVTINARPDPVTTAYAVEDQTPPGWEVLSISHGGAFDEVNRKVKWGPFVDSGHRMLSYDIVPSGSAGQFSFVGTGSFDGLNLPVSGSRVITISSILRWASATMDGANPRLVLSGQPSRTYVIEVSTNLVQWQTLQTISTDATGQYILRPANPATSPRRFYRARTP